MSRLIAPVDSSALHETRGNVRVFDPPRTDSEPKRSLSLDGFRRNSLHPEQLLNARPDDIHTVLIDGAIVKDRGELVHSRWASLRKRFKDSCDRIIKHYRAADRTEAMKAAQERHKGADCKN